MRCWDRRRLFWSARASPCRPRGWCDGCAPLYLGRQRTERHFDGVADDTHRVRRQRQFRGRPEHAAVTDVEGGAVQRAHQPRGAQPSFAQARMRVGTDVIQGEHPFTRVTDHDLAAADDTGPHTARRNLGEPQCGFELRHGILELDLGLEYRYRLADDPDAREGLAAEFELDFDPPGPMQRVSLDTGKACALAATR